MIIELHNLFILRTYKYEGYSKSKFQRAVKKAWRKIFIIHKNTFMSKLLNEVTAENEAIAVSENKFFYACLKEVCRLLAQPCSDTLHQILIIVEAL
jgi:hypothetical protein